MTVIGITGPSGAGKGEVSRILNEKHGFPILNADDIYHSLVDSPSNCLDEIKLEFGNSVITNDGSLDRKALAKLVFGEENKEKLNALNSITHKHVVRKIDDSLDTLKTSATACIIDAPLLIEADLCRKCDLTISVLAQRETRAERISLRDGLTLEAAFKRIDSQKKDSFYIENTDHTVINDGDLSLLSSNIEKILQERGIV